MEALLTAADPLNLCAPLAEWLAQLGFTAAIEAYAAADVDYVIGSWRPDQGPGFYLEYTWGIASPAHGTTTLWLDSGHVTTRLATGEPTATLAHVQQLLLGNARFARAYQAAHPAFVFPYSFT